MFESKYFLPNLIFENTLSCEVDFNIIKDAQKYLSETDINIDVLKNNNLITKNILRVKVILSGEITRAVNLKGIKATKGAKAAIEAAKGTISEK